MIDRVVKGPPHLKRLVNFQTKKRDSTDVNSDESENEIGVDVCRKIKNLKDFYNLMFSYIRKVYRLIDAARTLRKAWPINNSSHTVGVTHR